MTLRCSTQRRRQDIERGIADYYAALSDEDADEQVRWGQFALDEFPREIA
jgi:hypothetical protein